MDFALELLYDLVYFPNWNFQSVEIARHPKLKLNNVFQSLDGAVFSTSAHSHKSFPFQRFQKAYTSSSRQTPSWMIHELLFVLVNYLIIETKLLVFALLNLVDISLTALLVVPLFFPRCVGIAVFLLQRFGRLCRP